jgi:hypothetical protein
MHVIVLMCHRFSDWIVMIHSGFGQRDEHDTTHSVFFPIVFSILRS